MWVSDPDRAIEDFLRSIRLSPVDPEIRYTLGGLAFAFLIMRNEKALEYARRSTREMPRWVPAWRAVAVASAKTDRLEEAQDAARHILLVSPTFSIGNRPKVIRDQGFTEMFSDGLRKAGIPE